MPNSYKWFKDSRYLFQNAIDTDELKQMVRTFMDSPFVVDNDGLSTDQAVDNFNTLLIQHPQNPQNKLKVSLIENPKIKSGLTLI